MPVTRVAREFPHLSRLRESLRSSLDDSALWSSVVGGLNARKRPPTSLPASQQFAVLETASIQWLRYFGRLRCHRSPIGIGLRLTRSLASHAYEYPPASSDFVPPRLADQKFPIYHPPPPNCLGVVFARGKTPTRHVTHSTIGTCRTSV